MRGVRAWCCSDREFWGCGVTHVVEWLLIATGEG